MNNNHKILLVKNQSNRNRIKKQSFLEIMIQKIKNSEDEKLKNPKKGDLFVYADNYDEYFFYQFSGKKWLEVK